MKQWLILKLKEMDIHDILLAALLLAMITFVLIGIFTFLIFAVLEVLK